MAVDRKKGVPQVSRICVTRNPNQLGFSDRFVATAHDRDGVVIRRDIGITEKRAKKKVRRKMQAEIDSVLRWNASIDNMKCEPF